MQTILKVAVPVPLRDIFDYLPPDNANLNQLQPGIRLSVPFGAQTKTGILLEVGNKSCVPVSQLKKVICILDNTPLLSSGDLTLMTWASRYYHYPIGEVVSTALPVLLRKGAQAIVSDEPRYQSTLLASNTDSKISHRAHRQQALLTFIKHKKNGATPSEMNNLGWNWRAVLKTLTTKGLVKKTTTSEINIPAYEYSPPAFELNAEQKSVIQQILQSMQGFNSFLLDGITGSGKTEIYFQIIHSVLTQQKQVIVLLPEITLTPQLEERFKQRFKTQIHVFHSGLTEQTRKNAWLNTANGHTAILLGTRSAVFTPLSNPGLIILDEEHDTSFKQQEGFRFSAKDVAIKRAQLLDIPIILGSATPSLESVYNVTRNQFKHLKLLTRTGSAKPPTIELLDIRNQPLTEGLSSKLLLAIKQTIQQQQQVLLFINRRGFAPTLTCHNCGWIAQCSRCDSNLVLHSGEKRLRCHHCAYQQPIPDNCPHCKKNKLLLLGLGTERVEQILEKIFPQANIVRIDRDNTRRKGSLKAILTEISAGTIDILIGTQMLAKGHHFPNVTLVGILDTDSGLFSIDFRTTERLAQLIIQVSGRAGRDRKPGRVILQTRHPEHPILNTLIARGYSGLSEEILSERKICSLPPFSFQALLRSESTKQKTPWAFLQQIKALLNKNDLNSVQILGPTPAPMQKRAGLYRFQLLIQSTKRNLLHSLINELLTKIQGIPDAKRVKWSIDIDPIDLY